MPFYELTECYFPFFLGAGIGNTARLTVETAVVAKDIGVETVRIGKNVVVTTYDVGTDLLTTAYEKVSGGTTVI